LAALGARVTLAGIVGDDGQGDALRGLCEEVGIDTRAVLTVRTRRTTRKLRVLSQGQQLLRLDWEDSQPCPEGDTAAVLGRLGGAARFDALILSDYGKGLLTPELIARSFREHSPRTGIVVVDPKHRDFTRYRGAAFLTPNLRELSIAAGEPLDAADTPGIVEAARAQARHCDFRALIVTLGERGLLVVPAHGEAIEIPALRRAVYDVTGAGDTAAAVLTAALATGTALHTAAALANFAAGIAVGEIGAVAVQPSRIREALAPIPASKTMTREALLQRVQQWRQSAQRIVLTNGCFDLLHAGHLSLLHFAKSLGDILILAINSDAGVRRLKGPGRPVVSQRDRAALLGALSCVDAVTIFEEDTPLDIVRCVQPHILVKGRDYRIEEIIGRELVEAAGGQVVLAPLLPDYSTSALIARAIPHPSVTDASLSGQAPYKPSCPPRIGLSSSGLGRP
jgi:D-beta-D-heptose 7-phosphate kinase/D-beta-D-heptose 1-phosphate adenosyltransferase